MRPLDLLFLGMVLIMHSCSDSDSQDTKEPILSDLSVKTNIVGFSDSTPYGDGSGNVEFEISAVNATSYQIVIENQTKNFNSNYFLHQFLKGGTNDYSIEVRALNGNQLLTKQISIRVFVSEDENYDNAGELVWSDEFNSGTLDTTKWSYETGTGINGDWGTGQLDYATDRKENVSFQDDIKGADGGCLVITTRKESYMDRNYTSGRIRTHNKASWGPGHRIVSRVYGRDVRHQGQGFAFWLMPQEIPKGQDHLMWPQGGEIDIMEYAGAIPYNNLGSVHYAWAWENNEYHDWNHGHLGGYYNYETKQTPNPTDPEYGNYPPLEDDFRAGSAGFHTYGIDWFNDRLEFFVDGNVYHIHYFNDGDGHHVDGQDQKSVTTINGKRVTVSEYSNHFDEWHPFEHSMYAILSAGVGGSNYTYGGPIVSEAEFPCSVFIDWVRVYKL
ncbi:glycoside hydrolase family 16 protein [Formosa haliotis]|uniref:glycoside hydrolase family 16 protein n=1 Tax=Formosa haliotis TaxID=1555194 RepID=UPI000B17AA9B|nr:glycoside hydrolase family 16 protein [Formosa haliotis]